MVSSKSAIVAPAELERCSFVASCLLHFPLEALRRPQRERLLDACRQLAADRGASVVLAGVNAGCERAWTTMTAHGFRPVMQGVAMHRPNEAGYHTSDAYVIDDWR